MKHWKISTRDKVGIIAGVLLTVAGVACGLQYLAHVESVKPIAVCVRVGLPMFFLWLAWPDIAAFPRWVLQATVPTVILVAIYPKLLFIIFPVVLLMMFLQPKKTQGKNKPKK